ncbi:hypothetical protein C0995_015000 [Termitomyces sp. Mi166|nr:hypothetical protein C0995_015000 [Termitomyces sp. Mi166\
MPLQKELENFVVPTTNITKQMWACLKAQRFRVEERVLLLAKHIKMVQAAKAFFKCQGKPSQSFIMVDYKRKGKFEVLVTESEKTDAKRAFKSNKMVKSNSNKEEEKEKVHVIKKIKHEHVKELTGT